MSAKKHTGITEAVRDAAIGYTTVLLGLVCFLVALIVIMAGVRVIVGASLTGTTSATQTAIVANPAANETT